jgi:hypothetical protein
LGILDFGMVLVARGQKADEFHSPFLEWN